MDFGTSNYVGDLSVITSRAWKMINDYIIVASVFCGVMWGQRRTRWCLYYIITFSPFFNTTPPTYYSLVKLDESNVGECVGLTIFYLVKKTKKIRYKEVCSLRHSHTASDYLQSRMVRLFHCLNCNTLISLFFLCFILRYKNFFWFVWSSTGWLYLCVFVEWRWDWSGYYS